MNSESEHNPELERLESAVRAYYEAIDQNDLDRALQLFDPSIIYVRNEEKIEGQAKLAEFYRFYREVGSGQHHIANMAVEPPKVTVNGQFNGMLKNGQPTEFQFIDVFYFAGDKVDRRHTLYPTTP
jgi:predicted ester cyclase